MAEALVEGVLGSQSEEEVAPDSGTGAPDQAAAELAPGASNQTATALALKPSPDNPEIAEKTASFLDEQTRLLEKQGRMLDLQMEHLHEQRALNLKHMRVRRWRESLQLGLQVFITLVATVLGLGGLLLLAGAFGSRTVIVDAFDVPPALAARGFSGKVVASGVLDTLQKLRDATRSTTKALNSQSAWASDIKIQVPETGVSIGEIDRLLHERLGHDLHISGDLVQTDTGGVALTVRGDDMPAKTFQGPIEDLDRLTTEAAEYVYGRSQPSQYATYLTGAGRGADALAFLPGAFARAQGRALRADLANHWGNAYAQLKQPAQAAEKYRLAMALSPPNWRAWSNLIITSRQARDEETAWREAQLMLRAPQRPRRGVELRVLAGPALITSDFPLLLSTLLSESALNGGAGARSTPIQPLIADAYGLMHDPEDAARYIAVSDPDDPMTKAEALFLQAYAALDRGDAASGVPPLEAFWSGWRSDPKQQVIVPDYPCFVGLAYGLAGRTADAEAVFKEVGPWSRCYAFHGDVLAHAGDVAGAERMWAEGLRVAPDLPVIYLHRGLFELNRGDFRRAEADLAVANAKAPHWADPLKAWGDLLAREGRWKEALAKYDKALKYAPAWAELHRKQNVAASHA